MQGRKYFIVLVLAWVIILVWGAVALREPFRLAFAERYYNDRYIQAGAELYAANCASCHGPVGEGVVGPPLNIEAFKGNPTDNSDVYNMLVNVIARGRAGTPSPKWVRLKDGSWASYTAMPAWLDEEGGPLNDQGIKQIAMFIMMGDFNTASRLIPAPNMDEGHRYVNVDESYMSLEDQERAQAIFERGCVTCHTIGSRGGSVGPNLTDVGTWGLDEEFLTQWIKDPQNTPNRMPTHFNNFGGDLMFPQEVDEVPPGITYPNTVMPPIPMTDEERALLVKYLLGLGVTN